MAAYKKWVNPTEIREGGVRVKKLPEYYQWQSMRSRSEAGRRHQKIFTTYSKCTCCKEWDSFDVWLEWARKQVGFLSKDTCFQYYSLDKDILFKGNKIYSPETCVFVPQEVNAFLTNRSADRGQCPIGVHFKKSLAKYQSQISIESKKKHLGYFTTPEAAFAAYKIAKEAYAKQLAIKYAGFVDPRVVDALNNFEVHIDD